MLFPQVHKRRFIAGVLIEVRSVIECPNKKLSKRNITIAESKRLAICSNKNLFIRYLFCKTLMSRKEELVTVAANSP